MLASPSHWSGCLGQSGPKPDHLEPLQARPAALENAAIGFTKNYFASD